MEEESSNFSNPDMEVASVLGINNSAPDHSFRQEKFRGSQSLPTFSSVVTRSNSSNSEKLAQQSPFRPATVLTNFTRGNTATEASTPFHLLNVHHLAAQGEIEMIKEIINNVDEVDKNGFTPLIWACSYNQLRTAKYLVDSGANINYKGATGETALAVACNKGHHVIVDYLLNKCDNCNINMTDDAGNNALMYAVNFNHSKCVQLLLENGVDLTHRNNQGFSALDLAIKVKNFDIQKDLEKYLLDIISLSLT